MVDKKKIVLNTLKTLRKQGLINEEALRKYLKEGTWVDINSDEWLKHAKTFIKTIDNIKSKYYNLLGDDEIYDGLDNAIGRVQELIKFRNNKN